MHEYTIFFSGKILQICEFHIIDDAKTYDSQKFNNMVYPLQIPDIDFILLFVIFFLDDPKRSHNPIIFRSVVLSSYRRAPASWVMILSLIRRNNIVDISSYHFILTINHDSSHPILQIQIQINSSTTSSIRIQ